PQRLAGADGDAVVAEPADVEDVGAERDAEGALAVGRGVGVALGVAVVALLARARQTLGIDVVGAALDEPLRDARLPRAAASRDEAAERRVADAGGRLGEAGEQRRRPRRAPTGGEIEARRRIEAV